MTKVLIYRILLFVPIVLLSTFLAFCLLRLGGSDPVMSYLLHSNLPASPELIAELRREFGLDSSLVQQYWLWLQNALRLDFGFSYMSGRSVREDFLSFLPMTLKLVLCGFILSFALSIPLGIVSALYHNRLPDTLIRLFCFIGVSMPNFWLAFLLVLLFSVYLGWLPAVGYEGWQSLILPSLSIALMSLCINARLIRANMLEALNSRHVLYARLRGVSGAGLIMRHIFYNAFLPILTAMGMHIGELIGAALVIESVFGLPGIGLYSIQGIINADYPVIECFVLVLCVVFMLCNLIIDLLYALFDVRLGKDWHS